MIEDVRKLKSQISELQNGLSSIMTGIDSLIEPIIDLELIDDETTDVMVDMQNNWEDMQEATRRAALKRVHDIAIENIKAEKLRLEAMEEGEPEIYEPHIENGTPRTLYEE